MKRLIAAALGLLIAGSAIADAYDVVFTRRNFDDTAQGPLTPPHPTTTPGIMFYDSATLLPGYLYLGPGLQITAGVLDTVAGSAVTWTTLGSKPAWTGVFDGSYASLTSKPTLGTAAALNVAGMGNASGTQVVKGDDSRLSDSRTPTAHTHPAADINDSTSTGRAVLTAADATAARTAIGAGTSSFGGAFSALTGKPTTLAGYGISDAYPLSGNPSSFLTGITSSQVTTALGFTPYSSSNPSGFVSSATLSSTLASYATTSALTTGLSGKLDAPAGTTAQYLDGTGALRTFPVITQIQRARAQTNTSGVYTWTFPTAYGSGITPVVEVSIEDTSGGGAAWQHVITAVSNTSVTVQLTKTTAVTVLGISVLGIGTTPQAYVHLTAVAP